MPIYSPFCYTTIYFPKLEAGGGPEIQHFIRQWPKVDQTVQVKRPLFWAFLLWVTMNLFSPAVKRLAAANVKTHCYNKLQLTRLPRGLPRMAPPLASHLFLPRAMIIINNHRGIPPRLLNAVFIVVGCIEHVVLGLSVYSVLCNIHRPSFFGFVNSWATGYRCCQK